MKRALLVTERAVAYGILNPGAAGITGITYNGTAVGSTSALAMDPNVGASGKGIDCSNYYRALVKVQLGAVTAPGTITAFVGPKGYAANAAAPNDIVQVPGWEIDYLATDDGKIFVGEIFLQAVFANPLGSHGANSLWIKHSGDDAFVSISVVLEDPATEIADGRNTLQASAVYTG